MRSAEPWSRRQALTGLAAALALPRAARGSPEAAPGPLRWRNATLVLPSGATVRGGLSVAEGRILAVGPEVDEGEDLGGDWIFPGVFDAASSLGMVEVDQEPSSRDDRDEGALRADAQAIDGYNPRSKVIPVARGGGLTGALILPRSGGLISGQAAAVQTFGLTLAASTLRSPAALILRLGQGGEGGSRVSALRELRAALEAAPAPPTAPLGHPRPFRPAPPPPADPAARALAAARRRELPVLIHADRSDDIERAIGIFDEWGLDGAILGGAEAWSMARPLSEAGVPVVLSPVLAQPDSYSRLGARYDNARRLHEAGVRLAFGSGGAHFARTLRVNAGVLTAHGLPWAAAMDALCAGGPELYGLPGLGRLAPGAQATFVRCTGDPLQPRTAIRGLWFAGEPAPLGSHQSELLQRYQTLSAPAVR